MKNEKRSIASLISTEGLANNLAHPKMAVIDIRNSEEYKSGHIPAPGIFLSGWITTNGVLLVELPKLLFDMLGTAGITQILCSHCDTTDHPYPLADAPGCLLFCMWSSKCGYPGRRLLNG
jgi:hypothetical protein